MLLEFKMSNFKSFKDEIYFKMTPAPNIKDLAYSLIKNKINNIEDMKAISTAVIYGPNSSGKTNIIGGMEVFRSIILSGNIKNKEEIISPNIASMRLELIPNMENKEQQPVNFYIKFIDEDMLFEYYISICLGNFLDVKYDRKILEEKLTINNNVIYDRKDTIKIENLDKIKEYMIESFSEETARAISENNLDDKELFLNTIFRTVYSKKIADIILKWFEEKFKVIFRADAVRTSPMIETIETNKKFITNAYISEAAKDFGSISQKITYRIQENKDEISNPISVIELDGKKRLIPSEIFESFGTVRFLNLFPIILSAIRNGYTLMIDEFDASVHPMAIMNIIEIFHDEEINKKGAQLIFNTHNPIFLNKTLLRKDEIKFVEKDEEKKTSVHYSLSDFKEVGEETREPDEYMKKYFINRYGAIKNIDFSEIFIKNNEKKEVQNDKKGV